MLNKCLCALFLIKTIKSVGIFKYIRTHYGNQVLTLVRQYEKLRAKRDKLQLDIAFLTSCVDENIIPKFLCFRTSLSNNKVSHSYRKAQMKYIQSSDEIYTKLR